MSFVNLNIQLNINYKHLCPFLQELDPVTLHNQALMNMEQQPTQGFEKLQFLLQQNPFPPVTFGNLLLLYIKFEVRLMCSSKFFYDVKVENGLCSPQTGYQYCF